MKKIGLILAACVSVQAFAFNDCKKLTSIEPAVNALALESLQKYCSQLIPSPAALKVASACGETVKVDQGKRDRVYKIVYAIAQEDGTQVKASVRIGKYGIDNPVAPNVELISIKGACSTVD